MDIPRYVFIDSQCYIQGKLSLESTMFSSFQALCEEGNFENLTTDVVINEVKSWIARQAQEDVSNLRKSPFVRKQVLSSGQSIDEYEQQLKDCAFKAFQQYLDDCHTQIININNIDVSTLLDSYFNGSAPFGQKNKKNEFPDAINLHSLIQHMDINAIPHCYVVSQDRDLEKFCDETNYGLLHKHSLKNVLDAYNSGEVQVRKSLSNYIFNMNFNEYLIHQLTEIIERLLDYNDYYHLDIQETSEARIKEFSILSFSDDFVAIGAEVHCQSIVFANKKNNLGVAKYKLDLDYTSYCELEFEIKTGGETTLKHAEIEGSYSSLNGLTILSEESLNTY
ncbi:DUF4935 domain-containing protein [Vibrio fluvialis]|nr:DUF4935 domain-containing protein [Vibrio fluvialis]